MLLFSCSVVANSLWPHGLQQARPPCSLPSPKVPPSLCPLHWWCHLAISSSDTLFSCSQSFTASGSFPVNQLFISKQLAVCDQNTGASASASVVPMSIQDWFPLTLTGLISLLSKELSGVYSSTTVWRHQFFGALLLYSPALTTIRDHWEDPSLHYMNLYRQSNVSVFQHTV